MQAPHRIFLSPERHSRAKTRKSHQNRINLYIRICSPRAPESGTLPNGGEERMRTTYGMLAPPPHTQTTDGMISPKENFARVFYSF